MIPFLGLCAVVLCIYGSVLSLPLFILGISSAIFLQWIDISFSLPLLIVLIFSLLSIPAAAYLAGGIIDKASLKLHGRGLLAPLALVLCGFLVLESDCLYKLLRAVADGSKASSLHYLQATVLILSDVLIAAGLTSVVLLLVPLVFEIPIHWALDSSNISIRSELSALRSILTLLIFAIGFRLISDFFSHQFSVMHL